ncbi:MAG: GPW/gp25 family protein [Rhodanobacteraceae bacterium]|nr:GPW/gp25 family protein [Rhodanobacteraceae bacterium]
MSTVPDPKAFLGRGWSFPLAIDAGRMAQAEYEEDVRQAVLIILQTNHHERVMRADFGANLRALVFAPLNTTTLSLARHQVERALVLWEPRIDGVQVRTTAYPRDARFDIEVTYRVRRTNTFYNLVYPFYVSEGREEVRR